MKSIRLAIVILLLLSISCSEKMPRGETVRWLPDKPLAGQEVILLYNPDGAEAVLTSPVHLYGRILMLADNAGSEVLNLPMHKDNNLWQTRFTIAKDVRMFLLHFEDRGKLDDRRGLNWEGFVYGSDERPVAGAHLCKSQLLQNGGRGGFSYRQDLHQAEIELEAELALYPSSLAAKTALWELLLRAHPGSAALERVRNELRQTYEAAAGDEEILAALLPFFFKTGQEYIARQIIAESVHLLPRGPVARAARRLDIERETDPVKKAALQEAFERDFAKETIL